ncbi:MAG: hypothetical protein BM558_03855 [Roseobacter sp. MedPE-SW]|nr:MAG: hypothetical protein BM558_03855 [Roseobacter sp. MedPE-SW]
MPRPERRLNGQEIMPAAHMKQTTTALVLSLGALAATASSALSGDWKSTYFFSAHSGALRATSGGATTPATRLAFSADRDYGLLVLGGSYLRGNMHPYPGFIGATGTEQMSLRAGYDFGDSLGYISLGRQQGLGANSHDVAETLGIGFRVSLNRALQLTGEYLHHTPSGGGAGPDLSPNTISIGAAFRF